MKTPVFEIQFDLNGDLVFPAQEQAIAAQLAGGSIRNVVVLAHGWNDGMPEARALFRNFLSAAEAVGPDALESAIAIEVLWPSKKFAPEDQIPGGAASVGNPLNLSTYYVMKDRSGKIGATGLNPLLSRLQARCHPDIRFHLAGHSFGGRLVTAAVDGPNRLRIASLLLLQAAYSQNGLAANFDGKGKNGSFYQVLSEQKVNGPILITHSRHDKALGLAYPLVSRLDGCDSAMLGGVRDQFGGMGANGAQHVSAISLKIAGHGPYDFQNGKVFNLNGDDVIRSHGDVARPETAALLTAAITQCVD